MLINYYDNNFRIEKQRYRKGVEAPKIISPNKNINNIDIKRPLNKNHSDLSFKGLSFGLYKNVGKFNINEFLEFSDKYIGKMGRELFDDVTKTHKSASGKLIFEEGENIVVNTKTIPHLALDGILYPFKILPFDLLNGTVELFGHIPGFKSTSDKILNTNFFKNIRQRSKMDSKINSLKGLITIQKEMPTLDSKLIEYANKLGKKVEDLTDVDRALVSKSLDEEIKSKLFQRELKVFDPKSGNYDTKHERSLNRLVSGLPPAIFLANDAYNLSRMMDDDPKSAKQEQKTRFKQETSRILGSGYLTLITMGAFNKFINNSKFGIVLTTGLTVLVTEMYSRLSNGKHITRLTPEEARKENQKNKAPEAKIKPITNNNVTMKGGVQGKKEQQKPLLSFDTLMKASAAILAIGYGIKGFKNIPMVKNVAYNTLNAIKTKNPEYFSKLGIKEVKLENAVNDFQNKVIFGPFNRLYKRLTTEDYHVDVKTFEDVIKTLKDNGFGELAAKYEQVGKDAIKTIGNKTYLDLGKHDKKIQPLIKFMVAPFKFMWNTVTLPYWMVDEKLLNVFRKKAAKSVSKKDIDSLAISFDRICRQAQKKNFSPEKFKDFMQVNLLKSFNTDNISNVSNAELSNLAKTAATAATIWFLMTDNYNMVMLKSNGNDQQGADTKFKERFVQEGSRLFYQTLLIDLFNSTFRNQYNSSLLGMSWVTLVDTTLGEMLTRSSIGSPLKPMTRSELLAREEEQNNATGFKKKYFNFMQRLTGKRSIKSYDVAPKGEKALLEQPQIQPQKFSGMSSFIK